MNCVITAENMSGAGTLNEYQLNLLKKINNVAISLMPEFEDRAQAMNAISLDDKVLIQLLYTTQFKRCIRVSAH